MRDRLQQWEKETGDQGREPEPAAMYDSDMAVYVGGPKRANTPAGETLRKNIELMKRWAAEGRYAGVDMVGDLRDCPPSGDFYLRSQARPTKGNASVDTKMCMRPGLGVCKIPVKASRKSPFSLSDFLAPAIIGAANN